MKHRKPLTPSDMEEHAIYHLSCQLTKITGEVIEKENESLRNLPEYQSDPVKENAFIKKSTRRLKLNKAETILGRICMAFVMLLIVASIPFFTVTAYRENVCRLFDYIFFSSNRMENTFISGIQPSYIPDGFYCYGFTKPNDTGEKKSIDYTDGKMGYLFYTQSYLEDSIMIDTENSTMTKTQVNGSDATIYYKAADGKYTLVWQDELYMYSLVSNLSMDEIIKIAESVQ